METVVIYTKMLYIRGELNNQMEKNMNKQVFLDNLETSKEAFPTMWESGKMTNEKFAELSKETAEQSGEKYRPLDVYILWAYEA